MKTQKIVSPQNQNVINYNQVVKLTPQMQNNVNTQSQKTLNQPKLIVQQNGSKQSQSNIVKLPQIQPITAKSQSQVIQKNLPVQTLIKTQSDTSDQTIPRHMVKKINQQSSTLQTNLNKVKMETKHGAQNLQSHQKQVSIANNPQNKTTTISQQGDIQAQQNTSQSSISRKQIAQNQLSSEQNQTGLKTINGQQDDQTIPRKNLNKQSLELQKEAENTKQSQGQSMNINLQQQSVDMSQIGQQSDQTIPRRRYIKKILKKQEYNQDTKQQAVENANQDLAVKMNMTQQKATIQSSQAQQQSDQTIPRRGLNKQTIQQNTEQNQKQDNPSTTKDKSDKVKQVQNSSISQKKESQINQILIKEQFILEFKDVNKKYNLIFSLLTDMRIIIEDNNQKDNKKKQYILDINKDFAKLIQSINQSEEVLQSTQKPMDKKIFQNLNLDTLSDFFFQILTTPASRKVMFDYLKINIKDLVCSQQENEQFLKACLDQQIQNNNSNKSKDKSNDRYQFLELLGKGGQGEVWLYYDTIEKKTIVFKKFFKGFSDSFQKEKLILEKIKSANLCPPIISFDNQNYVIQCEKGDLSLSQYDDFIKINKLNMYKETELMYILKQLVMFVKILHEKYSIFHCDIKPDNIVLVSSSYQAYEIRMIDFGGSVDNCQDYPGCFTPAFTNPQILELTEDQLTDKVCIEGELYCVARTLCKLALKDASSKNFCKRSFMESINLIGDEYKQIRQILIKIIEKQLTTCDKILNEIQNRGVNPSENIKDQLDTVKKIQQQKLQNTQNNMEKEYLLQQIDFYEQMYAYKKGIQTIKTLLARYNDWTEDERKDLIMKQTRFEMEVQGIQDLSNIIQNNSKLMGEQVKYFELLSMVAQQNANIDQIIKKSEEIVKNLPQKISNEAFIINDIIATLLERQCAFEKAIEYRIINIEIARKLTDKQIPLYTPATQLASCFEQLGLVDKAFEYYITALESAKNSEQLNSTNLSNAYQNISIFFKNINAFQKAEEYQKKCLELRKEGTPDYCNSLSNLASIKEKLGYYKEAIQIYEESLKNLRKLLGNCGNLQFFRFIKLIDIDYWHNINRFQIKLMQFIKKIGNDHIDVGYVLNNMSLCLQKMGDLKNALNYCLESCEILKLHLGEKHSFIATCLGNIGDCYRELSQFDQAIEYAEKSLKINEEIGGKESLYTSNSLEKLGLIYYQKQQYEKAIQHLEKSLKIKKSYQFRHEGASKTNNGQKQENNQGSQDYQISVLLNNLALAYEGLMQDEKSLELQQESLEIKKKLFQNDNHLSIAISLGNIGMTLFNLARYQQSTEYLQKSIKILKEQNLNQSALQTYEKQLAKATEKIKQQKII